MSATETPTSSTDVLHIKHASSAHIAIVNADFVLVFAIAMPNWSHQAGLVPGFSLEEVATVSLSPITAKQLLRQLTQAVTGFEDATKVAIPEMGEIVGTGPLLGASGAD